MRFVAFVRPDKAEPLVHSCRLRPPRAQPQHREMRAAMVVLFEELKLAPEPACAAATAALLGPLRAELEGKRVGVLLCGTNTDPDVWSAQLLRAAARRG